MLLSVLAGPHPGATFRQPLQRNFKGTRIAWFKDLGGIPFDPRTTQAIAAQRKVFESLGSIVEEAEPDFTGADFAFKTLRAWLSASNHGERI